jgi:Mn2+/Fe2+ NRAMP family transporter
MNNLRKFIGILGPGILWSAVAIGETHLALLPYAGALFGMSVLWALLMVHILYYPNFEYGPRFAVATGDSLLDGYGRTRLGKAVYWFFLILMFVTPPLLMASLLSMTGSAFYAAIPALGFELWCLLAFIVTLAIVISRRYKMVERIAKVLTLILVLVAVFIFITSPPSAGAVARGLVPNLALTAPFMLVFVAVLRMPTDPTVSIFLSKWAQEKHREWGDAPQDRLAALKKSLIDIRTGFAISFLVGLVFLALGAVILKPRGMVPEGIDVTLRLAEIYSADFGSWIYSVFIIASLAAFWGTYVSAMDGMRRLFGNLIERLFNPSPRLANAIENAYILLVALAGLLMATVIKRPVVLVLLAVSMGLLYYPLVFGLNIHCVTRQVDQAFRPGKFNLTIAFCGLFLGVTALVLLILVRVVKIFN